MKKTVLVVDDEETIRSLLRSALEMYGYEVLLAENGKAGLEMALAHDLDLIITDCRMPKMDGTTMTHRLKEVHPHLPIVSISANPVPPESLRLFDGSLTKPFLLGDLASMLASVLENSDSPASE